jgi:hypothetical protein
MATVASSARSVNDVHYALLRHPIRSARPDDVTCRCNSIGRWYVTYDVTFFSASPLSYREIRCNSTSKIIIISGKPYSENECVKLGTCTW